MTEPPPHVPGAVLIELQQAHGHAGPQWGYASDDLNLTLLAWKTGESVAPHVNVEVDVVLIVVAGEGDVHVNGTVHALRPGQALLIPKGVARAIRPTSARFSYLSVHRRRRGLMPTVGGWPTDRDHPPPP